MQEVKETEMENIVIDCSFWILDEVLKQAQQVGILSDQHKVIVTSLVRDLPLLSFLFFFFFEIKN